KLGPYRSGLRGLENRRIRSALSRRRAPLRRGRAAFAVSVLGQEGYRGPVVLAAGDGPRNDAAAVSEVRHGPVQARPEAPLQALGGGVHPGERRNLVDQAMVEI